MTIVHFGDIECECGVGYTNNAEGRFNHQKMFEHKATPKKPLPPLPEREPCRSCRSGSHCLGQGGVIVRNVSVPCSCKCGERAERFLRMVGDE